MPDSLWQRTLRERHGADYAHTYADHFDELAATGADVHGEVTFLRPLLAAGARVLDAGCGTGRVAQRLAEEGYVVTGVDADAAMIEVARERAPGVDWRVADLADLDLGGTFDLVVMAGNVVPFVEADLKAVCARLAAHLEPRGLLVCGYGLDRGPPARGRARGAVRDVRRRLRGRRSPPGRAPRRVGGAGVRQRWLLVERARPSRPRGRRGRHQRQHPRRRRGVSAA